MKKINSLLGLEYTAISNNINLISTDSGEGFTRAKGIGLKSLFLFFLMALFFWASPTNTWGDTTTINGVIYTLNDADSTASVTGRTDALPTSVSIRGIVTYNNKNYTVTSIGEYAFEYQCHESLVIEIPASVTTIEVGAFGFCLSLTSVTFAKGSQLKTIGGSAFYGCSSLTSIEIPASVTSIGNGAFSSGIGQTSNLTTVTFAKGSQLETIGDDAFYGCSSLTSIEIPASVTSIGSSAFSYCSSLTSIEIPASVTGIGTCAFSYCSSLRIVVFLGEQPEFLWDQPEASSFVFYGTPKLSCVFFIKGKAGWVDGGTLFGRRTRISPDAFYTKNGVDYGLYNSNNTATVLWTTSDLPAEVVIPSTVTYNKKKYTVTTIGIGEYVFYDCSSLTSIEIPASVTSIGGSAFSDCSSLTSIEIPASVTSIGGSAFSSCSNLTTVTFAKGSLLETIGDYAFEYCDDLTSIEIPACVTYIGKYAFYYCSSLEKIVFLGDQPEAGKKAVFLGDKSEARNVFEETSKLSCVYFIEGKAGWVDGGTWCGKTTRICPDYIENGIEYGLHNSDNTATVLGYTSDLPAEVVIPSTVTYNNKKYTVSSIGQSAFSDCSSLTSIEIPAGVTSIGYNAFYGCKSLASIEIPASVTSIGSYAFEGCRSLEKVIFLGDKPEAGDCIFQSTNLSSVYFIDGKVGWKDGGTLCGKTTRLFSDRTYTENGIEYGLNNSQKTAFVLGYTSDLLTEVVIPSTVTYNNKKYTVSSIGQSAFSDCSSLTSIEIPASVTSIGEDAFWGCESLEKIVFLGDQPEATWRAFRGASKLSCVYFIEGKAGWKDGGRWCWITTKIYIQPPEIQWKISDGKLVLTFDGTLETSTNGKEWTAVKASSPYTVKINEKKKFFRCVK